jgi:hypothetical protein
MEVGAALAGAPRLMLEWQKVFAATLYVLAACMLDKAFAA